jgi:hypothetical protein
MNEIVSYVNQDQFMPVMAIDTAVARYQSVVGFVQKLMREGTDYGKVPGTGDKPVLLKPGAEKLATLFGLTPVFTTSQVIEDWTGKDFDGEPMFYYRYKCELYRAGILIATSEGSCNSRETKYRWRKGERLCPDCGQATIIKGKADYGGGWLCFAKKGGCGAKFNDGDPRIESQEVGRVANADIADQVNTIQKMAQKRAMVAAVLVAVNASEFFTQDIDDIVIESYTVVEEPKEAKPAQPTNSPSQQRKAQPVKPATNPEPEPTPVVEIPNKVAEWLAASKPVEAAYAWSLDNKTCNALPHAKSALRKIVDEQFGGSLKTSNRDAVLTAFYWNRMDRLNATIEQIAIESAVAVDGDAMAVDANESEELAKMPF